MLDIQGLRFRAALLAAIRLFFGERGFLEVDTPLRQPVILPESNIIPLDSEGQYLQTSPELCMKRLLAAGCEKIFQICPCFRKGERGRLHLEEFTMLEWYRTEADYCRLMDDCEQLFRHIVRNLAGQLEEVGAPQGAVVDACVLQGPWPHLTVEQAFGHFSPIPLEKALAEDCFEEMLVGFVEPHLGQESPVFLQDYPVEMASLARVMVGKPARAERFELYWQGIELANGFSELTDTNEQRARFLRERRLIAQSGRLPSGMPERFLSDLGRLSSAAGIALGVDRLLMLLLGRKGIHEVVSFAPGDFL